MREYEERIRLRELKRAAREAGHRCAAAKRARESEERVRFRKLRTQPCGAKTRAGHPCQRKGLGRGGRCPNHGGASTRSRKNELKRYALGTKNKSLKYNDDGSLTIYLGNKSPGKEKESNWLPAPAGNFSIWTRAYWPDKAILDGTWKSPVIEVVK